MTQNLQTNHRIHFGHSSKMDKVANESVDLIVTSPPYPMIAMWDECFANDDPSIQTALDNGEGPTAFNSMHDILYKTWSECFRVLKNGGIACINIGDGTRTIEGRFALYSNHSRIIEQMTSLGFQNLPNIIWRKQTNAPNKFMGSGMYPPGAYVTLEHEFILLFRKGNKREFKAAQKDNRRQSAYYWEERNQWFSDLWDFKGTKQKLTSKEDRERSAAYPFELPWRLIQMFSVYGDTVLDPYLGTGTSSVSALISGRNSIGYELDASFSDLIYQSIENPENIKRAIELNESRVANHKAFIKDRVEVRGKDMPKYTNNHDQQVIMTRQEREMMFCQLNAIKRLDDEIIADYSNFISS